MHRTIIFLLTLTGFIMTRHQAIAETIQKHGGAQLLADQVGCSANTLYRAASPEPSNADIAFGKIERLVEVTHDYRILDYLNWRFDFFKCAYPIMRASEMDLLTVIERLQLAQIRTSMHTRAYYQNPNAETKDRLDLAILNLFEIAEGLRLQTKSDFERRARETQS